MENQELQLEELQTAEDRRTGNSALKWGHSQLYSTITQSVVMEAECHLSTLTLRASLRLSKVE